MIRESAADAGRIVVRLQGAVVEAAAAETLPIDWLAGLARALREQQ